MASAADRLQRQRQRLARKLEDREGSKCLALSGIAGRHGSDYFWRSEPALSLKREMGFDPEKARPNEISAFLQKLEKRVAENLLQCYQKTNPPESAVVDIKEIQNWSPIICNACNIREQSGLDLEKLRIQARKQQSGAASPGPKPPPKFFNPYSLQEHLRRDHLGQPEYSCPVASQIRFEEAIKQIDAGDPDEVGEANDDEQPSRMAKIQDDPSCPKLSTEDSPASQSKAKKKK
eukprot:gnl/MRDRNA2_/MRDRNA2_139848_c0_seq1.p1 gnl/MRDRNA2_/MRDRNA2_139848_c0~~gnl/MRDRNA2_/MRDRNA2_139848_c0_seq1.p1  ORF type:complete len:244 (-),score=48.92 gnl/MRDRNA2_/MRDRNA2_139848_c0_seq1:109-810(-)